MKIGQLVKYWVSDSKSEKSKIHLETFEIYKVFENDVYLRNENFRHVCARKTSLTL